MWEVEQKFVLLDRERVVAAVLGLGGSYAGLERQQDQYFAHPVRDFRATDEALRIRRVSRESAAGDASSLAAQLTYKGPRLPGPAKTRRELETTFGDEDAETLAATLTALGFRPVAVVRKHRRVYRLRYAGREYDVCLDEVENVGWFLEVETLAAAEASLEEARQAVLSLAEQLPVGPPEPRSYLGLLLRQSGEC